MKLSALIAPEQPAADVEVTGLTADSRAVRPGFVFAALAGVRHDGRAFIDDALKNGAVAVLGAPGLSVDGAVAIEADNPRARLAELAARYYPRQPETLVAVTGTNGKSSTVEFLRQIWEKAGRRAATVGTLGVKLSDRMEPLGHTTPDPVKLHQMLDWLVAEGVACAAIEASSHGLAQHRLDGARLSAVGFSNLTQDHLDYHASFEDYLDAKLRLFSALAPEGAAAIVNVDGQYGSAFVDAANAKGLKLRRIGWRGQDLKIDEISPGPTSQLLSIKRNGVAFEVELPLVGEFQALNALMALELAIATGVDEAKALDALSALEGVRGRLELAGETQTGAPVLVDFAHTPDGLDKLLRALRPHTRKRIVIVFGAGGDRDPTKRRLMGETAARLADALIVTDDNPRSENPADIRSQVLSGCPDALEIGDRAEAIAAGVAMLGPGDALVIAGKGHETGQEIDGRVIPFDDVTAAREAIKAQSAKGVEQP